MIGGAHPRAERCYYEEDFCRPALIVIGNENKGGISRTILPADSMVRIPLVPEVESINASVAAGIIIYEAQKQRAIQGE